MLSALAELATGAITVFAFAEDKGARSWSQAPSEPRGRYEMRHEHVHGEVERGDIYIIRFSLSVGLEWCHRAFQRGRENSSPSK